LGRGLAGLAGPDDPPDDAVQAEKDNFHELERKRFGTGDTLMSDPRLSIKMQLPLLVLGPVGGYLRRLFEESRDELLELRPGHRPPIQDLVTEKYSPAAKVVSDLIETLQVDAQGRLRKHWDLLRGTNGGWDLLLMLHVRVAVLRLVCQQWWRLIYFYLFWPWPLAKIFDERLDQSIIWGIVQLFFDLDQCCVDEMCGIPIKKRIKSASDFLTGKIHEFLRDLFFHLKSQTVPVEERFGRIRSHAWANMGAAPMASTLRSNHMLSEAKSLHADSLNLSKASEQTAVAKKSEKAKTAKEISLRITARSLRMQ
jgi:hypothetical protein